MVVSTSSATFSASCGGLNRQLHVQMPRRDTQASNRTLSTSKHTCKLVAAEDKLREFGESS